MSKFPRHAFVRAAAGLSLVAALAVGCSRSEMTDGERLSAVEAASRVRELREQATDCLSQFKRSRGADYDKLIA